MRLLPPDLSSLIRAKLTSQKFSASPAVFADASQKPLGLAKSVESADQSFLSKVLVKESAGPLRALIQSLGLPQDALSSSLISFFKFFSLPLDAQIFQQIRREVLASKSFDLHKPLKGKTADSTALAASAAFNKGVNLSEEALHEYAAAIDPAEHRAEHQNEHRGAHEDHGGMSFHQSAQEKHQGHQQKRNTEEQNTPQPEDIKNVMNEIDAGDTLLRYLNKIPGKNGQKWIVLPFHFMSGAADFGVTLRILLNTGTDMHHAVERFAVDVLANEHRWFFLISKEKDDSYKGQIAVNPNLRKQEQSDLLNELQEVLGKFVSELSFIDDENVVSFFMDSRNDTIISVDEEA